MPLVKLYLDIDGVLLRTDQQGQTTLIPEIAEFLDYTLLNLDCYWLTTHAKRGEKMDAIDYLRPYFKDYPIGLIYNIEATVWQTLKTEAIDFDLPFIWIDDAPLQYEIEVLKEKGCLDNWLEPDINSNLLTQLKERVDYLGLTDELDTFKISFAELFVETIQKPLQEIKDNILHSILAQQKPEGGLELEPEVAAFIGLDVDDVMIYSEYISAEQPVDKYVLLSTALLLGILDKRYDSQRELWENALLRSRAWLDGMIRSANPNLKGKPLKQWVDEFLED